MESLLPTLAPVLFLGLIIGFLIYNFFRSSEKSIKDQDRRRANDKIERRTRLESEVQIHRSLELMKNPDLEESEVERLLELVSKFSPDYRQWEQIYNQVPHTKVKVRAKQEMLNIINSR